MQDVAKTATRCTCNEGLDLCESDRHLGLVGDNRAIDRFAARQHGAFNTGQARSAGFDRFAVGRKLETGAWILLAPTVYCLASSPPSWEREVAAAVLSRSRAIVARRSAAYLHGLRGFGPTRPEVLVGATGNARSPVASVIRSSNIDEVATCRIRGFEVSTVAETMLQLGAVLSVHQMTAVFEDAILSRRLRTRAVDVILEREQASRAKGVRILRSLAADAGTRSPSINETYLEAMLIRLLSTTRLPTWTIEHPFSIRGRKARVDVFIPSWRLVVEADGRSWHGRRSDFENDRARDNALATKGVQVLRFTYLMLKDNPAECLETILQVGEVRSP